MTTRIFRLLVFCAVGAAGCTPVVQPHVSSAEFLVAGDKLPGEVAVYVSEEFRAHTAEKTDISEFKTWKFELGPVAIDAFRFALESRFEDVEVKLGTPKFPREAAGRFFAAVQPSFGEFGASDPVLFRFENYKAQVAFLVIAFNAKGDEILRQTYMGEGVQQGSIGYDDPGHSAYPVAVQNAIKDAVGKFVNDLAVIAAQSQPRSMSD